MEEFRTSHSAPACPASPECWWKTRASDKLHGKTWRLVRLWNFLHAHEVPQKQIGAWVWEASPNEFQGQIHNSWQVPADVWGVSHNCGHYPTHIFLGGIQITSQILGYHICFANKATLDVTWWAMVRKEMKRPTMQFPDHRHHHISHYGWFEYRHDEPNRSK